MMPMSEFVESKLQETAADTAQRAGFRFAPPCEVRLRNLIKVGVHRMEAEHVLEDSQKVQEADGNMVTFVDQMVVEARHMGTLGELQEPTFFSAKSRLCPIWPFC